MTIEATDLSLSGLKLIQPRIFPDARGHFLEIYHLPKWQALGVPDSFVQDNLSLSRKNVLRGLHFQYPEWQGKLITVVQGEIYDVVVDLRRDSATFGKWHGILLSGENHRQLWVPAGFAHGFCVTGGEASVIYKCSTVYNPEHEYTLLWNDPALAIEWPVREPIVSEKDSRGLRLSELPV